MVSVSTLQKTVVYGAAFTVTSCSFFYYKIQCKSIISLFGICAKYLCSKKLCPKCCNIHVMYWVRSYSVHLRGNCRAIWRIIIWKFNKTGVNCLNLQRNALFRCSMYNVISFFIRCFEKLFLGGAPTSICHFFCPSICLSHSISQKPYIIIFGTHM